MRLDKFLADKAVGTRSQVRAMVQKGHVTVNDTVVKDASMHITLGQDRVALDGVSFESTITYHLMMNKPSGVLTAARDKKQPTVLDLLPPLYRAADCMPIGRLDKDTTGLLLFTTDGQLNHLLLSPKRHVDKVYRATLRDALKPSDVAAFHSGLELGDFKAQPAGLDILSAHEARVTVHEGKFHQVKRMFEAVGNEVLTLCRESFGGIALDASLGLGAYRDLTENEIALLYQQVQKGISLDE